MLEDGKQLVSHRTNFFFPINETEKQLDRKYNKAVDLPCVSQPPSKKEHVSGPFRSRSLDPYATVDLVSILQS